MYKIIGADQKEYGPVSADQMRQWIAEGRVNAQTLVQAEGDANWKPLSAFPEFGAGSSPVPPPLFSTRPAMPVADARARALQDINGPAIGLIIAAALGIAGALAGAVMSLLGVGMAGMRGMGEFGQNAEMLRVIQMSEGIVGSLLRLAGGVFVIIGAVKMKKLENYGLSMAASIVAMLPCISPCCLIGLPIGIWALVILNKPEIKDSFH